MGEVRARVGQRRRKCICLVLSVFLLSRGRDHEGQKEEERGRKEIGLWTGRCDGFRFRGGENDGEREVRNGSRRRSLKGDASGFYRGQQDL